MNKIQFTKMQGIGNDYVYINCFKQNITDPATLSIKISDRHFGVGSDGLVLIMPSSIADLRMRMFNADGTEAEMCGNATRCVGKYAWDHDIVKKHVIQLETKAGIKIINLIFNGDKVCGATVDMGEPILSPQLIPTTLQACENQAGINACIRQPLEIDGQVYDVTAVSMGNPHAVLFMENIKKLNLPELGPKFENNPAFPKRTNTEFVEVISRTHLLMRVWERGAGETLACGTGACAALVAAVLNGLTERKAEVELLGGILNVDWDPASNHVYMSGPAVTVFDGEYYLD